MALGSAIYTTGVMQGVNTELLQHAFEYVGTRMTLLLTPPSSHKQLKTARWLVCWLDRIVDELTARGIRVTYTPGDVYRTYTALDALLGP
jgi:hypothetical protein